MRVAHNRPFITAADREAVDRILASGWIAQGPEVRILESNFSNLLQGGAACAVSSGTAALFLTLKALGSSPDSKVAVPTYACSALLNAVYQTGASPELVDIKPDTFCIDASQLESINVNSVIAVHTFGAQAEVTALKRNGRKVIEDCCHSLGSEKASSTAEEGDAAIFSFYATKLITGGQGGLIWARNSAVVESIRDYREFDCRKTYSPRFNLQMTDIQAAMINSQFVRLNEIRDRRHYIAEQYLADLPLGLTTQAGAIGKDHMTYRFIVLAPELEIRDAMHHHLFDCGIESAIPIQRYELLHRYLGLDPKRFPVAERLVDTTLSLPIHAGLSDAEVDHITHSIRSFHP